MIATASLVAMCWPLHWRSIRKLRQLEACWNFKTLYIPRCFSFGMVPSICLWKSLTCSDHLAAMPAVELGRPARRLLVRPTYGLHPTSIRYTIWLPAGRTPRGPCSCSFRRSRTWCSRFGGSSLTGRHMNSLHGVGKAEGSELAVVLPFPCRSKRLRMSMVAKQLRRSTSISVQQRVWVRGCLSQC